MSNASPATSFHFPSASRFRFSGECAGGGVYTGSIARLAHEAAVGKHIARSALREAERLGLLSIEPRSRLEARNTQLTLSVTFATPQAATALHLHGDPV
jgi:hypothetical protein